MGAFNYNNPLIRFLVRVANMLIVSFYWLLCCIPVVTILPSCAALYHCVTRVVMGNGNGVTKDFFASFKGALKPGLALSAILAVLGLLVYLGVRTGMQIWSTGVFGAVYMAAGVLIVFVGLTALVFIPPVLSRFEGGMSMVIRLALYFSGRNLLRSVWYVLLLALAVAAIDFFPLLLLILPAVYVDLIRGGVEKTMKKYIQDAGLEDAEETVAETLPAEDAPSAMELDRLLSEGGQEDDHAGH